MCDKSNQINSSCPEDITDIISFLYWWIEGYKKYSQSDQWFMAQGYARYTFIFLDVALKDIWGTVEHFCGPWLWGYGRYTFIFSGDVWLKDTKSTVNQIYGSWPKDIVDILLSFYRWMWDCVYLHIYVHEWILWICSKISFKLTATRYSVYPFILSLLPAG